MMLCRKWNFSTKTDLLKYWCGIILGCAVFVLGCGGGGGGSSNDSPQWSASLFQGEYSFIRFSSDRGGADTGAQFTSGVGYIDFDGAGTVTSTTTGTANGQPSGEAFLPGSFSATYSVASNGEVTIAGERAGYVSPDGNIIIWTDPIPEDPTYMETGIAVGIKTN
jgi:hypothetical protein